MSTKDFSYDDLDQSFRDRVATIDQEGKRVWVYPQKPKGRFHQYRIVVATICLALLFGMPFIRLHGEPFMLFNVLERKFILFGILFGPQDFFLLGLSMITLMVFIILFTVIYGRLFCGWICPQTIFMEMVFRKIEYFIEGDSNKQRALAKAPMSAQKFFKKASKHIIFFAISFLIANTFLAYIISTDELFKIITDPVEEHLGGLTSMILFTGVFYWVFAFFREQVCTVVCPYGRLQGVLLDKNSIVVAYDYMRGEKRGKYRKNEERTIGDCIDCHQCVAVCPTGIDIRNGTQLECVNCTACIDACDDIMDRVGMPRGLITFASEKGLAERKPLKFSMRIAAYSAVLLVLVGILSFALISRSDTETTILRTPGMMYQENADGTISNLYNYKVNNKTFKDIDVTFKVIEVPATIKIIGKTDVKVAKETSSQGTMFIYIKPTDLHKRSTKIKIGVYNQDGELLETVKTSFLSIAN
jgi:cytochrome c oxidase accessory protein FixG